MYLVWVIFVERPLMVRKITLKMLRLQRLILSMLVTKNYFRGAKENKSTTI